jgi:hypothetical protein
MDMIGMHHWARTSGTEHCCSLSVSSGSERTRQNDDDDDDDEIK